MRDFGNEVNGFSRVLIQRFFVENPLVSAHSALKLSFCGCDLELGVLELVSFEL
jgi:hypothetical protein